jgi:hypothetical protein
MPCSFGPLPYPKSGMGGEPNGFLQMTVADRYIPLVTAAYGTWVARPARTTMLRLAATAPSWDCKVRPVLGKPLHVGKSPEGSRQGSDRPARREGRSTACPK